MYGDLIILCYIIVVLIIGIINKVNCYESFIVGINSGTRTVINMFSYLFCFTLAISLFVSCGIINDVIILFNAKISPLIVLQGMVRTFSASSSLAITEEIIKTNGVDSFLGVLTTFMHIVTDTTFFIIGFYCSLLKIKNPKRVLLLGFIINLTGYVLSVIATIIIFKII